MKRIYLSVLCLFAFVLCTQAAWTPQTVPSPKVKGQDFYVSNPDGVLQSETERRLDVGLAQLNRDTYVELAVVAIDSMSEDYCYSAHSFALDLFNHWGIGDKDKNTGVLVFLARASRDIQIITGDGLAGILTDGRCGEILDDNIEYLSDNNFDGGLLFICEDIANELMADENRAELLLGWKPGETDTIIFWTWYIIVGFILMIIMALCGYHVLNSGKPGESVKEVQSRADELRFGVGCLTWLFPLPMLIYYITHIMLRNRIKRKPYICAKCGHDMVLLDDESKTPHLTKNQLFEQQIHSYEYEIWRCPDCGEIESHKLKGKQFYKYDRCPQCDTYAMLTTQRKTIEKATSSKNGKVTHTLVCQCCGHTMTKDFIVRKQSYSSSNSRSSSRSWGSSSWGGSSSSSSGSWGGGFSSGGGAGRSF